MSHTSPTTHSEVLDMDFFETGYGGFYATPQDVTYTPDEYCYVQAEKNPMQYIYIYFVYICLCRLLTHILNVKLIIHINELHQLEKFK